jgi:hypothetical protein
MKKARQKKIQDSVYMKNSRKGLSIETESNSEVV